jgi:hypothetical protein
MKIIEYLFYISITSGKASRYIWMKLSTVYAFVYAHTQYLEQKVTMHSEYLFCFEFTMSFAHEEHSYLLQM